MLQGVGHFGSMRAERWYLKVSDCLSLIEKCVRALSADRKLVGAPRAISSYFTYFFSKVYEIFKVDFSEKNAKRCHTLVCLFLGEGLLRRGLAKMGCSERLYLG